MQDEYIKQNPELVKGEELADWIIINSKGDDITTNDVTTKMQLFKAPMEDVWMKIEVRQNRIQDALLRSQGVQDSVDDFFDRLSEFEERLNKEKPVSANLPTVKEQQNDHEVCIC